MKTLVSDSEATAKHNRKFLSSDIQALEYCGHQGIALNWDWDSYNLFAESKVIPTKVTKKSLILMSETEKILLTFTTM